MSESAGQRLFGTDGIRGVAGQFPLDERTVAIIGRSLVLNLARELGRAPRILIGRDTRESGPQIEFALARGALELGPLGDRVAVAKDQQIELLRRVAALVDLHQRSGIRLCAGDNELVLSTLNSGATTANPSGYIYSGYQGTSQATPHIAGIASLMFSVNPALTPGQVLAKLQATARVFPTGGPVCASGLPDPNSADWFSCQCTTALCGPGVVDAGAAVTAALEATAKVRDLDRNAHTDFLWRYGPTKGVYGWLLNGSTVLASGLLGGDGSDGLSVG
jgi:subtilisin family serine protease